MRTDTAVSPEREGIIEIRLTRLQQLFNSFDPSPFHDRNLDQDAEDYIVDSADEFPLQKSLKLIIHVPVEQLPRDHIADVQAGASQLLRIPDE
jgi:hypothetical protein